jgi:hypothetical protein
MRIAAATVLVALATVTAAHAAAPLPASTPRADGIVARLALTPRTAPFAERVSADLDVLVDRRRIDMAAGVRAATVFLPFTPAGPTTFTRRDAGSFTRLHWHYPLLCVDQGCTHPGARRRLVLPPARIVYRPLGGLAQRIVVRWPVVAVDSRLDSDSLKRTRAFFDAPPWRGDVVSLPAVSYGARPAAVEAGLIAAGILLLGLGGFLVARAVGRPLPGPGEWRRPRRRVPPLERALLLVERARESGAAEERRKALERLARELGTTGADELAGDARELAWAEPDPEDEATGELTTAVRRLLSGRGNGRHA